MAKTLELSFSSDDEFPELDVLLRQTRKRQPRKCLQVSQAEDDKMDPIMNSQPRCATSSTNSPVSIGQRGGSAATAILTVRRRKLGPTVENHLLKPWNGGREKSTGSAAATLEKPCRQPGTYRHLRTRKHEAKSKPALSDADTDLDTDNSDQKTKLGDSSEFLVRSDLDSEDDDNSSNSLSNKSPLRGRSKPQGHQGRGQASRNDLAPALGGDFLVRNEEPRYVPRQRPISHELPPIQANDAEHISPYPSGIAKRFAHTTITTVIGDEGDIRPCPDHHPTTPPLTPTRTQPRSLVSPKILSAIPKTPHRPSMDLFWSQEFVDEWNDEHSPKKLLLPPVPKSPSKGHEKSSKAKCATAKEAKKSFEQSKHQIAAAFLRELDSTVTEGKLEEMARTTGGIQITWNNKLNTTAGRANWRRETVRTNLADGTQASVTHRHHASIELAGKVIDDEHRLLNVVAHEFCHLANFMVSGITGNPHGKEFKQWAAKCSLAFGHRGINVTTKHSYDIDFKYIWECTGCGTEFKRHSKSINPERHRCGVCKSPLSQTKPIPRRAGKASEYQNFVREQMKAVKEENPGSPQKDVMRLIAQRWSRQAANRAVPVSSASPVNRVDDLEDVADRLEVLSL